MVLALALLAEDGDGGDGAGLLPAAINNLAVAALYSGEASKVRFGAQNAVGDGRLGLVLSEVDVQPIRL